MNRKFKNVLIILLSIITIYCILMTSTLIVTKSKIIYYFDIDYLNITQNSMLTKEEIKKNYDYTIEYLFNRDIIEFKPPTLPSSADGSQHFLDVRNLFNLGKRILLIGLITGCVILYILRGDNFAYKFLKYSGITLICIPVLSLAFINVDFTSAFTLFHELMFKNDKWLLDPATDPIINMMPEEFFAHCGVAIIVISAIFGILMLVAYKWFHGKSNKNNCKGLVK